MRGEGGLEEGGVGGLEEGGVGGLEEGGRRQVAVPAQLL